jgi:hypothetical protein
MFDTVEGDSQQIKIICTVPEKEVEAIVASYSKFSECLCRYAHHDNYNTYCTLNNNKHCGFSSWNGPDR